MAFKTSLAFGLLVFILQNIFSVDYAVAVERGLICFLFALVMGLAAETLYSHIKNHLQRVEVAQEGEEQKNKSRYDEISTEKAGAISRLLSTADLE